MDRLPAAWQSQKAEPASRARPPLSTASCPATHQVSQIDMHASERASILAELTPPFTLLRPGEQLSPVVFCSPHSGRICPKAFLEASRLDAHTLPQSED